MDENTAYPAQPAVPSAALRRLDRLVGTWQVSGGTQGRSTYTWMDGGFFLIQHLDMVSDGRPVKGLEVIGHLQPFGGETSADIHSRYYGGGGETFDYVYEMDGDTLTIWGGERDSPAYYRGTFSADGNTLAGAWVYPGGGGYESTSIRITP
jgi:hypothetical protein